MITGPIVVGETYVDSSGKRCATVLRIYGERIQLQHAGGKRFTLSADFMRSQVCGWRRNRSKRVRATSKEPM